LPPVGAVTKNQAVAGYSKVTGTKNQQVGFMGIDFQKNNYSFSKWFSA
jgi:hypothetical protein